ncbi:MAG TPA: site-2 protease family protein [Gaiellaceae bacterium]|nr:site-2 protease family protein [Gaiellaceae bacterium]
MSLGVAILALAVLVLVHEAGHFVVARLVGMTPRKFYLGFGPPLVKHVRNGVEYGIAALPLGGYVKIPGMHRPAVGDLRGTLNPLQQRELAPALDALDDALERDDEPGARAAVARLRTQLGETRQLQELEWSLAPDAYWRQRAWKKVAVIAAGPVTNVLIAFFLFVAVFMLADVRPSVARTLPDRPAAAAGVEAGDEIVAVSGRRVDVDTVGRAISGTAGAPFTLTVKRDGRLVTVGPLRAKLDHGVYHIGVELVGVVGPPGQPFPAACASAFRLGWSVTSGTVSSIVHLFAGQGTRNISSAYGIVRATSNAYRQSLQDFLAIVGLISLSLGLLNLLPVLPLDGGHITMSVLERLRGRAFSQLAYARYSAIGLTLFVFLLYLGLRNDFSAGHS